MNSEKKKEFNVVREKNSNKKMIKKIILILVILIIGFIVVCLLPFLYFFVKVLYGMFIDIPAKPKVKHGEFPFELVYQYKGEKTIIKDTIICDYNGYSYAIETGNTNNWSCDFKNNSEYGRYYVDLENLPNLYIVVPEASDYYMGDIGITKNLSFPYISYVDESTGIFYEERESIDVIDIKIVDWKPSKPLKNNFK